MDQNATTPEHRELLALRARADALRSAGYELETTYSGWSVRKDGATVGGGTLRGATPGRSGILVITDAVGALERAVACAEHHQTTCAAPEPEETPAASQVRSGPGR